VQVVVGRRGGDEEKERSEESLREARYGFLAKAAAGAGARYVVTAHTADDQVETVLHNLLRGTGLAGLAGVPRVRQLTEAVTLVRPLLDVTRSEVIEYLITLGQAYREDASNQCLDYTRNRIRHELLPLLEREYNPHVRAAIRRLSQIAGEAEALLDQQAESLLRLAVRPVPAGVEIQIERLEGTHPALVRQMLVKLWQREGWPLQDMSFGKWEELLEFVQVTPSESEHLPPQVFPGGVRSQRQGNILRLTR
jgi:tRNA(Ile)-lysidine synthase